MIAAARGKSLRSLALVGAIPLCLGASSTLGDPPDEKPPAPPASNRSDSAAPPKDAGHQDSDDTPDKLRQRVREFLSRSIESSKQRLERMERAVKLLDDGASLEQIRAVFPEASRPGNRFADWRERIGGPGMDDSEPGPRPGGGGPGRAQDNRGPGEAAADVVLTDEQKQFVKDFLKNSNPDSLRRLDELESRDSDGAKRRIGETWTRVRWLWELRSRDPELYQLRLEDIRAGHRAAEHSNWIAKHDLAGKPESDPQRQLHMGELKNALHDQFVIRGRIMEHDIAKMRDRVTTTQQELANRPKDEANVIDEGVRSMLQRSKQRAEHPPSPKPDNSDRKAADPAKPAGSGAAPQPSPSPQS